MTTGQANDSAQRNRYSDASGVHSDQIKNRNVSKSYTLKICQFTDKETQMAEI